MGDGAGRVGGCARARVGIGLLGVRCGVWGVGCGMHDTGCEVREDSALLSYGTEACWVCIYIYVAC